MTTWLKLVLLIVTLLAAAVCYFVWRDLQQQRSQLQAELKAAQSQVAQTEARQQTRDRALQSILSNMEKQKAQITTPSEALAALPDVLPLPKPFTLDPVLAGKGSSLPGSPTVHLPAEDLKPLYDFASQCRECQARLTVTQADLKDEQSKTQLLTKERNAALRAARGGSVLQRVLRATKWIAIGAAAGAVAVKIAAH